MYQFRDRRARRGRGTLPRLLFLSGALLAGGGAWGQDFNGDGKEDLAVGVPLEDITVGAVTHTDAGCVNVLYGTGGGLTASIPDDQLLFQGTNGIEGTPENFDLFGYAISWGDYNGDGYNDLAVGVPGEDAFAGSVHVFFGSPTGLDLANDQVLQEGAGGLVGVHEADDWFGVALTSADFHADHYTDLAIGVSQQDVGNPAVADAGAVHIVYGSGNGLTGSNDYVIDEGDVFGETPEREDEFGGVLASGDFNADGFFELAVSAIREDVEAAAADDAGIVVVFDGQLGELGAGLAETVWTQDDTDAERTERGDWFGYALAVGHFDGNVFVDLAMSAPREDLYDGLRLYRVAFAAGPIADAGAVVVLYGSLAGLSSAGSDLWHQGIAGVTGEPRASEQFGYSLAAGSLKGDAFSALAIGVPNDDLDSGIDRAGCVNVLYGSLGGLTTVGSQMWHQNRAGAGWAVEGVAEVEDHFGLALTSANYDGDGGDDLVIAVPDEDLEGSGDVQAGCVNILFGSVAGLTGVDDELWTQDSMDVQGAAEDGDRFGNGIIRR